MHQAANVVVHRGVEFDHPVARVIGIRRAHFVHVFLELFACFELFADELRRRGGHERMRRRLDFFAEQRLLAVAVHFEPVVAGRRQHAVTLQHVIGRGIGNGNGMQLRARRACEQERREA